MERKRTSPALVDLSDSGCKELQRFHPECLIATIPDPDSSRSGYRFDLDLEALQRAAEALPSDAEKSNGRAYVLDRYWLPCKHSGDSDPHSDKNAQEYPGVLVFRATGQKSNEPPLLIVFLVGETPTSGIHIRALHRGLDLADQLNPGTTLNLVGTNFSGAFPSLIRGLERWEPSAKARIFKPIEFATVSPATAIPFADLESPDR